MDDKNRENNAADPDDFIEYESSNNPSDELETTGEKEMIDRFKVLIKISSEKHRPRSEAPPPPPPPPQSVDAKQIRWIADDRQEKSGDPATVVAMGLAIVEMKENEEAEIRYSGYDADVDTSDDTATPLRRHLSRKRKLDGEDDSDSNFNSNSSDQEIEINSSAQLPNCSSDRGDCSSISEDLVSELLLDSCGEERTKEEK